MQNFKDDDYIGAHVTQRAMQKGVDVFVVVAFVASAFELHVCPLNGCSFM